MQRPGRNPGPPAVGGLRRVGLVTSIAFMTTLLACGNNVVVSGIDASVPAVTSCGGDERWTQLSAPDLHIVDGGLVGKRFLLWEYSSRRGYTYRADTETWRRMAPIPPGIASFNPPTAIAAGRFFVWDHAGGAVYDPAADSWTSMAPMAGEAPADDADFMRPAAGSSTHVFYISNDENPPTLPTPTRMMYDIRSDKWYPLPDESAPTELGPLVVWADTKLLVWGGRAWPSGQLSNQGARFDPAGMTWSPMSTVNAPPPMVMPSIAAVWTGKQLFVWGSTAFPVAPSGGLYDPARDAWRRVTQVGAPIEVPQLAVWTGKHVIVVGGHSGSYGIYQPSTDTWYPMMPAPTEAVWHVAAWDGCRVLLQSAVGVYAYEPPLDL